MHTFVSIYRVGHLTFFFQQVLFSWMVTLSSCLIWQIIGFILSPNEYGFDTLEQHWEILRHYYKNHGNVCENCVRILKEEKHHHLHMLVKEPGILIDKPKREKPKTVRTPESIATVAESVCEAPSASIHRRSQQLNIWETSLRRISHRPWYDAIQSSIGSGVEANSTSNAFSIR